MTQTLLGVMQGRLLPKYNGRYQAHPVGYWQDEFPIAASLGLDLIEWILDFNDADINPISSDSGAASIAKVSKQTDVHVKTICADYFMEAPLHSADHRVATESRRVLTDLIPRAAGLGVTNIVIPCVDQSKINSSEERSRFVEAMRDIAPLARKNNLYLCLETDLAPLPFKALLAELDSSSITVNYDTGNSASLGFSPKEELAAYGNLITDIHIKDRVLGGGSIELGNGNTKFEEFFTYLKPFNYQGPFIMQAFRDDEGLEVFKRQLTWTRKLLSQWGYQVRGA